MPETARSNGPSTLCAHEGVAQVGLHVTNLSGARGEALAGAVQHRLGEILQGQLRARKCRQHCVGEDTRAATDVQHRNCAVTREWNRRDQALNEALAIALAFEIARDPAADIIL